MSYQNLLVEEKDGIVYLTLNRPKALNALNSQTLDELDDFFGTAYADRKDIHGVIMQGSGDRAFAAGADIKEFIGMTEAGEAQSFAERGQRIFFQIERFHRPVIAIVNGFALGGGCELAMACHMRIATDTARFGQPEVNLGIIPGYGGTQRLTQIIGKAKSLELVLTGNMIKAEEAQQLGLANHVLPDQASAQTKAEELLQTIATKGPLAIEESIIAINAYFDHAQDGFVSEAVAFGRSASSDDFKEGATAFVEKRQANFKGN